MIAVAATGLAEAAILTNWPSPYNTDSLQAPVEYRSAGPFTLDPGFVDNLTESAAPAGLVVRMKRSKSSSNSWQALGSALAGWVYENRCSWNPLSHSYGKCKKSRGWVRAENKNLLLLWLCIQFNWVLSLDHSSQENNVCVFLFSTAFISEHLVLSEI